MKIYVVRHGQSTHNVNQDIPHNPDPPLTALGREQAQMTASALWDTTLGAVALYASPPPLSSGMFFLVPRCS